MDRTIETDKACLTALVENALRRSPQSITPMPESGGTRRYYLITLGQMEAVIGTCGTVKAENEAFVYLSEHFKSMGLPVPQVIANDPDTLCYIQTIAGETQLYKLIAEDRRNATLAHGTVTHLLDRDLDILAMIQFRGAIGLDWKKCYPIESMDRRSVMWDLNYFKYDFLKLFHNHFDEPALENDFEQMCRDLTEGDAATYDTFQLRDFQSRNIMVDSASNLKVIDFQGGRRGLPFYDAVSFIYQSRAGFDSEMRRHLEDTYFNALHSYIDINRDTYNRYMQICRLFRLLQTLGAYGFRGLYEKRQQFIESLPAAIAEIESLPAALATRYPELFNALQTAARTYHDRQKEKNEILTVTVTSFSYKKGYPADSSGNGGGFVFDCRAMHNPGRYDEYRELTGRDRPVADFLTQKGECQAFVQLVNAIVYKSVQRYIERGFTSLSVAFGCTGGQHRSVFCADLFAAGLHRCFPQICIKVCHREQNISETFNPTAP